MAAPKLLNLFFSYMLTLNGNSAYFQHIHLNYFQSTGYILLEGNFFISTLPPIIITIFYLIVELLLKTLIFLLPTNALLYYTYKMLKYTVKISHDCSYMFRSIWTIIRDVGAIMRYFNILYV